MSILNQILFYNTNACLDNGVDHNLTLQFEYKDPYWNNLR